MLPKPLVERDNLPIVEVTCHFLFSFTPQIKNFARSSLHKWLWWKFLLVSVKYTLENFFSFIQEFMGWTQKSKYSCYAFISLVIFISCLCLLENTGLSVFRSIFTILHKKQEKEYNNIRLYTHIRVVFGWICVELELVSVRVVYVLTYYK